MKRSSIIQQLPKKSVVVPKKAATRQKKYSVFVSQTFSGISIEISNTINGESWEWNFEIDSTEISCGVNQLHNLPTYSDIDELCEETGISQFAAKAALKEAFSQIEPNKCGCAFLILSNNLDDSETNDMNAILNSLFKSSSIRKNPNSGNQIKIWTI